MHEKTVARIQAARRIQTEAAIELWNARLSVARRLGSVSALLELIASPIEAAAGNNCECNNGCNVPCGSNCGALSLGDRGAVVLPGAARPG